MLESIHLEPEQKELLRVLAEAARNVPYGKRQKFYAMESIGTNLADLLHPGLPEDFQGAYIGDIEILGSTGLLQLSYGTHGTTKFDVTPIGFKYYEQLMESGGSQTEAIESNIRQYLSSSDFQSNHSAAFTKWSEAESLLWRSQSKEHLTTIGHLCRECIQLYANDLVERFSPAGVDPDVAHTVSRLRSIISLHKSKVSESKIAFADALIAYWGTLSDLIQRQEHGALKEGEDLIWEDARRIVFQTANLLFEIDRILRIG